MTDCFANAWELFCLITKEYVEDLRAIEAYGEMPISSCEAGNYADAIEVLLAENAKLEAERDAAVADIKTVTHMDDIYRFTNKIPPVEQFQLVDDIKCGLCPYCNEGVNEEMNYCSNCGQKLDWDDEDGEFVEA